MKVYLALISAAVLGLAACSQESSAPAQGEPAAEAPAPATSEAAPEAAPEASAVPVAAADDKCAVVVDSDDAMKYNMSEINISKTCKEFSITLKHMGKLPKAAMGHNIVIAKTEDVDGVAKDGASVGPDGDFLKAGDERVIAHTKLIGGGEEDTVKVDVSKFAAGNKYEFFCSFPGHISLMRGTVNLVE
ncbi:MULTISPECIES: azurin [unclassified Neisseria]|uniref:azurin n=1 Tax=unclassified Neisseria TaxID=2623750 RepID=UPI00266587C6|nr:MULTISPECIES: azurin [unclassified Neisseria]MDO1510445.1 azurin [Neisseria sp. MVDL19-042950]MDO1516614.1 azurin [Neisseria sp. MVDL18-041461]MDO1563760.1 azurin [Neisseria sp. MVDL20-010259]